jgi:hypothetical protein
VDGYVYGVLSTSRACEWTSDFGVISCTMDELHLLRKKLLMVHRHPTLYRILALGFLCITILLMCRRTYELENALVNYI